MNNSQSITVIGSSAASNFSEKNPDTSWPTLLRAHLPEHSINVHIRGGLTPVRCIDELVDIPPTDLLILHLGTSVGWPIALVGINNRFGIDFEAEHGLHQPAFRSPMFKRRVKGFLKAKFRNAVKYGLFIFGLYKPRVNVRELDDQVRAVLHLAYQKAPRIVWIQHRALHNRRIWLERSVYSRFYRRIVKTLKELEGPKLQVIALDSNFLCHENYLLDYVHLSDDGHRRIYELVKEAI